jgi:hypothetical protein
MAGGLMNLVSVGQQNVILNGTNFGLQKFRVDFDGSKTLRLTEPSVFSFKIPRYADLLMDTYLSIVVPHIWSPILPPRDPNLSENISSESDVGRWAPYEFKWIENLGAKMISKISFVCGNYRIFW